MSADSPASPATAPAAGGYVEKSRLAELIAEYRSTGNVSDELAHVLLKIAGGVWDRYHYTGSREDFVQDVVLHLLAGPLRKADPSQNCFAYLTTCCIRYGGKLRTREQTRRRKEGSLIERVRDQAEAQLWQSRQRRRMAAIELESGGA